MEDLKDCLDNARENIGQPEMYSWKKENRPNYLLTVTNGGGPAPPTWILHVGDGDAAAVVWIAMSNQPEEILAKIKETLKESGSDTLSKSADLLATANSNGGKAVLERGDIFADNYEIISKLGQGGMGIVYKTRQVDSGQIVALKVLHPHLLSNQTSRARFEQEARKSNLSHPNLIRILKFGFSAEQQPYIAMEFLNGCPLRELFANGTLELPIFKEVFMQVCEGLAYAHNKGVVHRDIKPCNIMICSNDSDGGLPLAQQILHKLSIPIVKIVDFGIAKSNIVGSSSKLTPTGDVLGSPHYMSPEQCTGGLADPRSDIYSLGIVMYEAATGSTPFQDPNPIKLILSQISGEAPGFSDYLHEGSYSLELEKIVMKALEKDPARRYQTADELYKKLEELAVEGEATTLSAELIAPTDISKEEEEEEELQGFKQEAGYDESTSKKNGKKKVTLRFCKFTETAEKDLILRALQLSRHMLKKGADLSVYLDFEASHLAQSSDSMAPEFHVDFNNTEKIKSIQIAFQKIIKAGGTVKVSEYWLRYYGIHQDGQGSLVSGIKIMSDSELSDYLLQRTSSIINYT